MMVVRTSILMHLREDSSCGAYLSEAASSPGAVQSTYLSLAMGARPLPASDASNNAEM
jgi:hypothetical protein